MLPCALFSNTNTAGGLLQLALILFLIDLILPVSLTWAGIGDETILPRVPHVAG